LIAVKPLNRTTSGPSQHHATQFDILSSAPTVSFWKDWAAVESEGPHAQLVQVMLRAPVSVVVWTLLLVALASPGAIARADGQ
jgi:hypothetical protein